MEKNIFTMSVRRQACRWFWFVVILVIIWTLNKKPNTTRCSKPYKLGLLSHYSCRTGYSVYTYYYSPVNKKAADLGSKLSTANLYFSFEQCKGTTFFWIDQIKSKLFAEKGGFCFQKCNFYHSEVQPYYSEVQLYCGNNRATLALLTDWYHRLLGHKNRQKK